MTLYSYRGGYPAPPPFTIVLSNGDCRTNPTTFSIHELDDAGYTPAPTAPTYDPNSQQLVWLGDSWEVRDLSAEVITARHKSALQAELDATDDAFKPRWVEDIAAGTPYKAYTDWVANRERLRTSIKQLS